MLQKSAREVEQQAETSPSAGQTAELSQLKADVASAQEALRQAQLAESSLRAELDLSRANQASARDSLQQAEQSIDTLQHELSLLQHGESSSGSPDARSQQVGVFTQTTRKEGAWEGCLVKVMRQLIIKLDACPNFAHPAVQHEPLSSPYNCWRTLNMCQLVCF